jgi:hypothetical protein
MIERKHLSFPDIGQYRNVVRTIQDRTRYAGKDENGNAIFDTTRKLPKICFTGTVKLHGTNAGCTFTRDGQHWAQSRENIITPEDDNAGFAKFVESDLVVFEAFSELCFSDSIKYGNFDYITIFGEWCGTGIQKGVAISQLPKMFVIFDVKYSYDDIEKGDNIYAEESFVKTLKFPDAQIYNIYDYQTYEMEIDFEQPAMSQNKIIELVLEVEAQCPVGKSFGVDGIGEGIVFRYRDADGNTYRWKSKGEKHSSSKVKTLVPVDTEKLTSVNEFIEYAVTESRLNQSCEKTFGIGAELDITKMGDFIRWIVNDIQKEESDTMEANGLTPKDINSGISKACRNWLIEKINSSF